MKTAVEWFEDELTLFYDDAYIQKLLKEVKAMEKDQIIMAYHKGEHNGALRVYHKGDTKYYRDVSSNMYYSRTFKTKKNKQCTGET
jgi:hypothetical protein